MVRKCNHVTPRVDRGILVQEWGWDTRGGCAQGVVGERTNDDDRPWPETHWLVMKGNDREHRVRNAQRHHIRHHSWQYSWQYSRHYIRRHIG